MTEMVLIHTTESGCGSVGVITKHILEKRLANTYIYELQYTVVDPRGGGGGGF